MLPSVKDAHEEAQAISTAMSEKREKEEDEPLKKRMKLEGIKKIIE